MVSAEKTRHLLPAACLLLILLTLAAFWQVRHHDFVNYDDYRYVLENPRVRAGLTREGILWAFSNLDAGFWHPLTWLSHMLDCHLYGINPEGHHFNSLLLHMANALLLLLVMRRMTGSLWKSWFVAALFAIHPLHVESVAWVSERKDVLSTLFWMMTMGAYVLYVERPGGLRYSAVIVLLSLGLMAKTMVVTLPFVLLLLDFWPLRRIGQEATPRSSGPELPPEGATGREGAPITLLVMEKVPLLILSALSVMITFYAESEVGALASLDSSPMAVRAANALVSYAAYIGKMLWPQDLSVFYLYPAALPGWKVLGSILLLLLISIPAVLGARRRPYLLVGWLWYLGTLLPVIGLVRIGSHAMADRYTYVPLIGLFIMAAWGLPSIIPPGRRLRTALPLAAAAILTVLGICTVLQVRHWRNSRALFEHATRVTRENFLAHKNLGAILAREGRLEEAERHLSESLRIHPGYDAAHFHLANVLVLQGRLKEALLHYGMVPESSPDYARSLANMGHVYDELGNSAEAVSHYERALQRDPGNAGIHNRLGLILFREHRFREALHHFSEALTKRPEDQEIRRNLERAREALQKKDGK